MRQLSNKIFNRPPDEEVIKAINNESIRKGGEIMRTRMEILKEELSKQEEIIKAQLDSIKNDIASEVIIPEEEIINYRLEYEIDGIYGKVKFIKNVSKPKDMIRPLPLKNEIYDTECEDDMFSYSVSIIDANSYKFVTSTDKELKRKLKGLPKGITEERYYKMATMRELKNLTS